MRYHLEYNPYRNDDDAPTNDPYMTAVSEFRKAFKDVIPSDVVFPEMTLEQERELRSLLGWMREIAYFARKASKEHEGKCEPLQRVQLMTEELAEVIHAMLDNDPAHLSGELSDLMYVTTGTALSYGLGPHLLPAFKEVHRANMSKLSPEGTPFYDDSGKITKGPYYQKPHLERVLNETRRLRELALSEKRSRLLKGQGED